MGMYDSYFFNCPECGDKIEVQSKSGFCELDRFEPGEPVPIGVLAEALEGPEVIRCCDKFWTIKIGIPKKIIPKLEPSTKKEINHAAWFWTSKKMPFSYRKLKNEKEKE